MSSVPWGCSCPGGGPGVLQTHADMLEGQPAGMVPSEDGKPLGLPLGTQHTPLHGAAAPSTGPCLGIRWSNCPPFKARGLLCDESCPGVLSPHGCCAGWSGHAHICHTCWSHLDALQLLAVGSLQVRGTPHPHTGSLRPRGLPGHMAPIAVTHPQTPLHRLQSPPGLESLGSC